MSSIKELAQMSITNSFNTITLIDRQIFKVKSKDS